MVSAKAKQLPSISTQRIREITFFMFNLSFHGSQSIVVYVNFVCVNDLLIVQDDKILFNDLKLLTYCEQCVNIHA